MNSTIKDKAIAASVQENDAQQFNEDYTKIKMPEHWMQISIESINILYGVIGCNHCGCRNG